MQFLLEIVGPFEFLFICTLKRSELFYITFLIHHGLIREVQEKRPGGISFRNFVTSLKTATHYLQNYVYN